MNKQNQKTEFSKKIFNIIIALFIIVLFYSMALMWKTNMTDGLMYLIPSVTGLTTTCVGFYFWKAKMENMVKLSQNNNMSMSKVKEIEEDMTTYDIESEGF